ncbi:MAG: OadG family protein [Clostridium argentinense]|uniref:OadG family protein n=1 Tax=Clostridium faecium TaxID=2762223 RepID=A0ABR8YWN5_9CLOT|nr:MULTISPECIES: OadG family protein [Clostridium]MBD8048537.1 OadG family protein [Clostridium faecium]MBS5824031.1 OadG family protein [Clostridium argentinense]MDU1350748.1 OadG family protein [Clostridium argentinense]
MNEKIGLLDALGVSAVAMIIVFAVLVILMYLIKFQSFLLRDKKKNIEPVKEENPELVSDQIEIIEDPQDDLELVAVIMATLSTHLNVPTSELNIKSIKRVNNGNTNWGNNGTKFNC